MFTKQILTWKIADRRGYRNQYIDGLEDIVKLLRGCKEPTIIANSKILNVVSTLKNENTDENTDNITLVSTLKKALIQKLFQSPSAV